MRGIFLCGALASLVACEGSEGTWTSLQTNAPGAVLSIWGSDTNDVWAVGARSQMGGGPSILHYDGTAWSARDSGQASLDLWWVFGFPGGDVFFSGSGGTILRYRNGAFEKMPTPRQVGIVFGMWGTAANDVWAVGSGMGAGAIVWHFDGVAWTEKAVPAGTPSTVFKVHGQASNDVWMSAADGKTLHWNGSEFELVSATTDSSLFSVGTAPGLAVVAGGPSGKGELIENSGNGWEVQSIVNQYRWRGIGVGANGDMFAVGEAGTVARRDGASWEMLSQKLTQLNFHAAWIDPDGGMWGVGGDFERPDPKNGFILYYGTSIVNEVAL